MRYLPYLIRRRTRRHAGMLAKIGVASIDDLFANVPADKRSPARRPAEGARRAGGRAHPRRMAAENVAAGSEVPFFVGAGAYRTTCRPPSTT
jgi:glycine dehydrogenase subunit 1